MTRVGAIDCGTNSIRLLIADVLGGQLRDVHREMHIVRLGQGVDATGQFAPDALQRTRAALVDYAIHYFRDFVLPAKKFRQSTHAERAALIDLRDALAQLTADAPAEKIQEVVYEIGRRPPFLDQKRKAKDGKPGVSLDWFNMLYQVLLGQERGPRFGSFVAAYGLANTIEMIDGALARSA